MKRKQNVFRDKLTIRQGNYLQSAFKLNPNPIDVFRRVQNLFIN